MRLDQSKQLSQYVPVVLLVPKVAQFTRWVLQFGQPFFLVGQSGIGFGVTRTNVYTDGLFPGDDLQLGLEGLDPAHSRALGFGVEDGVGQEVLVPAVDWRGADVEVAADHTGRGGVERVAAHGGVVWYKLDSATAEGQAALNNARAGVERAHDNLVLSAELLEMIRIDLQPYFDQPAGTD